MSEYLEQYLEWERQWHVHHEEVQSHLTRLPEFLSDSQLSVVCETLEAVLDFAMASERPFNE
ncbi:hypothetical protein [Aestuariivirga sp.]|uniref:hypothetical protein n=1 Tax=Aestuariivirga sp. TaxID=2650926 RepID=UPI003BAC73F9